MDRQRRGGTTIVRAITRLARELGMDVIAEGFETEGQASYPKSLDGGYGQGSWFSRPLDAEGISAIVNEVRGAQELGQPREVELAHPHQGQDRLDRRRALAPDERDPPGPAFGWNSVSDSGKISASPCFPFAMSQFPVPSHRPRQSACRSPHGAQAASVERAGIPVRAHLLLRL